MRLHGLQHRHRGQLSELEVQPKIGGTGRNIGVRRQMKHAIEAGLAEQGAQARLVEHVELDETKGRPRFEMRDVAPSAQAQVVHAPDLLTAIEQPAAKMTADEFGAAGHQGSHGQGVVQDRDLRR
jgi:hypothetical protein